MKEHLELLKKANKPAPVDFSLKNIAALAITVLSVVFLYFCYVQANQVSIVVVSFSAIFSLFAHYLLFCNRSSLSDNFSEDFYRTAKQEVNMLDIK